jgi:hypothetical protein
MTRWIALLFTLLVAAGNAPAAASRGQAEDTTALRRQIEQHFDIVPLTEAIGLRPKNRRANVRLIEIANDGDITINGEPVTGRELRQRLGAEADPIIRLSFLDANARRAIVAPPNAPEAPDAPTPPTPPSEPTVEPVEAERPRDATPAPRRDRRSHGDRVRIFGDTSVAADEVITGQVVAVMGSVRIDGEVGDQVVAVMGSVDLGPKALVRGDVVSVGGRVRRAAGAQVRGEVNEVAIGRHGIVTGPLQMDWPGWWGPMTMVGFGPAERLVGSGFRFLLMVLLVALSVVIARPTVESAAARLSENPIQATLVGIAAQILVFPILIVSAILLAISIIGIPLLLLLPFVVLLLLFMALFGFSGSAFATGQWARRRLGFSGAGSGISDAALGVFIILLPLLIGRIMGFVVGPLAFLMVGMGLLVEFVAWTSGFGAVLTNSFSRWQARRSARHAVTPPVVG